MNLNENISRVKQLMGLLKEEDELTSLVYDDCKQLPLWPREEFWEENESEDALDTNI